MTTKRFRLQYKFWLDVNKADEHQLAEIIEDLKQGRVFTQALRDGIRLIVDLLNGNLDVLLALFPWIEDAFYQRFLEQQPAQDFTIQEQLARLERLLIEQGNTPISTLAEPVAATSSGRPKPMVVPQIASPAFDDNDGVELVIKKAKSDGRSAQNFLDSAFSLLG